MNAKEFLRQYAAANKVAHRLEKEYKQEQELIDSIKSALGGDGMPHGNGISKTVEDRAIRLSDKAQKWKKAELDAVEKRQEVFDVIHDVPGIEGDILIERYINLLQWEDICERECYSWSGIHQAHRRGLAKVQEILDAKSV